MVKPVLTVLTLIETRLVRTGSGKWAEDFSEEDVVRTVDIFSIFNFREFASLSNFLQPDLRKAGETRALGPGSQASHPLATSFQGDETSL